MDKLVYTPEEAGKELHMCVNHVYDLLQAKKIPHIRNGRNYLIPVKGLERWLMRESLKQEGTDGN